jgi:hypothetical protein
LSLSDFTRRRLRRRGRTGIDSSEEEDDAEPSSGCRATVSAIDDELLDELLFSDGVLDDGWSIDKRSTCMTNCAFYM